jgi:phospholipase C
VSDRELTRRGLLKGAGAALAAASCRGLPGDDALAALAGVPRHGRLRDIEHVVILIQENRSFDHYFGTLRGVRGFSDPTAMRLPDGASVFAQPGFHGAAHGGRLYPYRLDTRRSGGECTHDITHGWAPQHRSWNGGRMDGWVRTHLAADGAANGPLTMAYLERADLPFYHALADAFTICDHYFGSVMGPTDPNRLYSMSGTLDPDGKAGGPLLQTHLKHFPPPAPFAWEAAGEETVAALLKRLPEPPRFSWTTMPEQLQSRGISWKVYAGSAANVNNNVLIYFKQYFSNAELGRRAFVPTFPGGFEADVAAGTLPQVSWVLAPATPLDETEHPGAPVSYGEYATARVLSALTTRPRLWAKTALFVTWDENGGFFDHVAPPTPPVGTAGEYITVSRLPAGAEGIRGPIGLGFRVPLVIASPFARGGFVSSEVFDHTSVLRFLETRFGAEVPNLSAWRRSVTGDLTSAFSFAKFDRTLPRLPTPSLLDPRIRADSCRAPHYPVPPNRMPYQEPSTPRRPTGTVF